MNGPIHYHEGAFPPADLNWVKLVPLIGPANAAVARYDGILSAERPIFKGSDFIRSDTIPKPTAQRILNVLKKEGILRELQPGSGSRSAILAYPQLLNLAEGYEAF